MKTFSPRPQDIERRWYVLDAKGVVLGRVASQAAKLLRGKHKPIFAPHADTGDHVIIVNAGDVVVTGGKEDKKIYYRHSGYPGGLTAVRYSRLLSERPVLAVEKAIRGMLPKNRLGRQMFRKLAVYQGAEHPHQAQKPHLLAMDEVPKWEGLPQPKPKQKEEPIPKTAPARRARKAATAKGLAARTGRTGPGARRTAEGKPTSATRRAASRAPAAKGTPETATKAEKEAPARTPRARKAASKQPTEKAAEAPKGRFRRSKPSSKKEEPSTEES